MNQILNPSYSNLLLKYTKFEECSLYSYHEKCDTSLPLKQNNNRKWKYKGGKRTMSMKFSPVIQ